MLARSVGLFRAATATATATALLGSQGAHTVPLGGQLIVLQRKINFHFFRTKQLILSSFKIKKLT